MRDIGLRLAGIELSVARGLIERRCKSRRRQGGSYASVGGRNSAGHGWHRYVCDASAADYVHFRVVGSGECVLLAPDGGEKDVELPNAEECASNRRHPLHVNVHLGRPGEVGQVYVAYAADGVLTADAQRLCGGVFLNR